MDQQSNVQTCTSLGCRNPVTGDFKTCLSCRLYKRAANVRHKAMRRKKLKAQKAARAKQPWSQERWELFVQGGGLEGL